jgi:hypothetical protein
MDVNSCDISEMQTLIGVSEELTNQVLYRVKNLPQTSTFLPVYNLLLLERYETTVLLIQEVMKTEVNLEYLSYLQKSRFYLQRKAVPGIIKDLHFESKKCFLINSLKDDICEVVKEAVLSIQHDNPFNNDDLLEISINLFKNKYSAIKVLAVDLLVLIKQGSFLLIDFIKSTNWKLRLRVATLYPKFNLEDQIKISSELKKDHVDEVRIELSKSLTSLEHIDLLEDPCEFVRAHYLENIIDIAGDQYDFKKLLEDSSWEVKKVLLNLKGDNFKKITISLIRSSTENVSWRIKHEILCLVDSNVHNEFASRPLLGFLIKNLNDKVCEVRQKAEEILSNIIKNYNWIDEYCYEIETMATNPNYLYRVSAVPVVLNYDFKFKSNIGQVLYDDPVINVRDRVKNYIRDNNLDLKYVDKELLATGFEY